MLKALRAMATTMVIALAMTLLPLTNAVAAWDINSAIDDRDFSTASITVDDISKYAGGAVNSDDGSGIVNDTWTTANSKELAKKIKNANKGKGNGTAVTVGEDVYYLDDAGLQSCRNYMASVAKKYDVKQSVDGMGTNFSVSADLDTAGVALSGLEGVVSMLVGILCYAIVLGMTFFTALDLCYITMPVFRNKCEDMKQSGSGAMVKTNKTTGETQLRWITDEAVYSVQACSIETGKSPLGMYLKQRVKAFILLAIVLFILFTGNIQLIVNIAINFVAGIMDALGSLGG